MKIQDFSAITYLPWSEFYIEHGEKTPDKNLHLLIET